MASSYGSGVSIPVEPTDALALATAAIALWDQRDTRMRVEQEAYELTQNAAKKYEEDINVPDAAINIEKFAEEVSRVDLQISCAPETEEDRGGAQRIEDAQYWWLREVETRHVACLHAQFQYEAAHFLALRGWLCAEVLHAPDDPGFPWNVRLIDPIEIYPDRDAGKPGVIVHRYHTSFAELKQYWGEEALDAALDYGLGSSTNYSLISEKTVTCYGFYSPTEMAVLLEGGGWLKFPVEHGYGRNPLVVAVAPGAPYHGTEQGDEAHISMKGPGLLRTILGVINDKRRIAMRVMRMLTRSAAPALIYRTNDQQADASDIETEPNSISVVGQADSVEPVVPPPVAFQYATGLLSMLQDAQGRGGVGPALFGEGQPGSGYDRTKQIGTSLSKVETYLQTLGFWYEAMLRLAMRQYAYLGGPDLQYVASDRSTGLRTAANRLSPYDVIGADTRLEVKFGNLQNVDLMQMGNLSAMLVDRGVVDPETALDKFLKLDNPQMIIKRSIKYQGMKDANILQLRVLYEMANDTEDPMAHLWGMALEAKLQAFIMGMQPQPPQMGMPGSPPLPGTGAPSAALPSEMAGGAGMPPGMVAMGPPQPGAGMQGIVPPEVGAPAGLPF